MSSIPEEQDSPFESDEENSKAPLSLVKSPTKSKAKMDMRYLIRALVKYNASDLHIKVGRPPLYRISGKLIPARMEEVTSDMIQSIVFEVMNPRQREVLEHKRQVDFSFKVKNIGRFRCNVYFQRTGLAAAIRMIPIKVPSLDDLRLPKILKDICIKQRGLFLVTGSTGSGKSTTLASMIQHINENQHVHVLLIEDPIEFIHKDFKSTITQREVGADTASFQEALTGGLRQDPDIIVIGEMRDCDIIQVALTAAETGHLVLATLHTQDAKGAIERIVDVFPGDQQNQVRIQLASTLVGVVAQQLVVCKDGKTRVPACEIMIKSPSIEQHILKNELEKIPDAIAQSGNYYQMQTMNMSLERLVRAGEISVEEALLSSPNPDDLRLRLAGVTREEGYDSSGGDIPPITR